jgi:CTP synthase
MAKGNTRYVFVTGGVISSLGKGLSSASAATLLEARGLKVTLIKMDPYINVDPGTMSPYQHGEVFVTDDGAETDLDIGHYERYANIQLSRKNNFTAGQIYESVIGKERRGEYLGRTVQVIPHITDEIKTRIRDAAGDVDIALVEVGGTVGDIESLPFLEAIRQMENDEGRDNVMYIHLTLIPHVGTAGELKTKPTQHSVKALREIGITPDVILCRTTRALSEDIKKKIALFCSVPVNGVIAVPDVDNVYKVPLVLHEAGLDQLMVDHFRMKTRAIDLRAWKKFIATMDSPRNDVVIGIVGKYTELQDSYKSLNEAIVHGGVSHQSHVQLKFIDADRLKGKEFENALREVDGLIVPGGFGARGADGKIESIRFAREKKLPFFGICFGMQLAVIEYARNVCGFKDATSREFGNKGTFVIDLMEDQRGEVPKGGTMRLGAYACDIDKGTRAFESYRKKSISERHRHRYEFNNAYKNLLIDKGLVVSGINPDRNLVEIVELADHPWFLGCQFHPEFKSRPLAAHPLFASFIGAALQYQKKRLTNQMTDLATTAVQARSGARKAKTRTSRRGTRESSREVNA